VKSCLSSTIMRLILSVFLMLNKCSDETRRERGGTEGLLGVTRGRWGGTGPRTGENLLRTGERVTNKKTRTVNSSSENKFPQSR
jgi:hypothetical protein